MSFEHIENSNGYNAASKVTIADIARESNVSSATVSLVLRNKPGISLQTRQRVLDIAQSLGYLFQASNQAQQRAGVDSIGLLVKMRPNDRAIDNHFYAPVLSGIDEVCQRHQINLNFANVIVDEQNVPCEAPRILKEQQVDGVLMVGIYLDSAHVSLFEQQSLPIVLVDGYATSNSFDAVVTDNFSGAYHATSYLISSGHRHIAIAGSQAQTFPSIQERRAGYRQAIADHYLEPHFADCPLDGLAAQQAVLDLLNAKPHVTAVFGANDIVAIAAIRAAEELGRLLPGDLSVVGFDNVTLCQHITPALTTMRVDKMGMGRLATQLLMNRIEYPNTGPVQSIIRPNLIERHSVQALS